MLPTQSAAARTNWLAERGTSDVQLARMCLYSAILALTLQSNRENNPGTTSNVSPARLEIQRGTRPNDARVPILNQIAEGRDQHPGDDVPVEEIIAIHVDTPSIARQIVRRPRADE